MSVRQLHLDAFSGIAGNMMLGALLDLGLPRRTLQADLRRLGVRHALRVRRVRRGALAARYVKVSAPGRPARRNWAEIRRLLRGSRLAPAIRELSEQVFENLARAEARVHGVPLDRVHFHEVGAVDALVDVVGSVAGLLRLGVRRVSCSPLALGHGRVETEHGTLPLPAPATLELLRGVPVVPAGVAWETVTPTGAALVATLVHEFRELPALRIEAIGVGAGDDRVGPLPNVLRAVLGREDGLGADRVVCLEANLDDFVPEHFEYLMERLFQAGALDVALQHLHMKKSRPGFGLRVLAHPSERTALAAVLFAESTTLGVRAFTCDRLVLEREIRRVVTPFGPIRVKLARMPGGERVASAEYEDCKRAARRGRVPLREVVRVAEEAARRRETP